MINIDYKTVTTVEEVNHFLPKQRDIYIADEGETIYIIVRHGENESNVNRTYDGRTLNLPLTEKGIQQGRLTGEKLSKKFKNIDAVIVNTMQRTSQTAKAILEAFPNSEPKFIQDESFLERYVGIKYEGGSLKDLEPTNKLDKDVSSSSKLTFEEKMAFVPEEGIESYGNIWKRAHQGLQKQGENLKGKVVLVITHSGTIRSLYWHLTQKLGFFVPYKNFKPDNGASMIVSVKEGNLNLLETNNIKIVSDDDSGM